MGFLRQKDKVEWSITQPATFVTCGGDPTFEVSFGAPALSPPRV